MPDVPVGHGTPESAGAEAAGAPEPWPVTGSGSEPVAVAPAQLVIISDQLTQLRELLEAKISDDERDRQWVTQLTSELAEYRSDFVFRNVLSRVFRDLIQWHDALSQALDPAAPSTA